MLDRIATTTALAFLLTIQLVYARDITYTTISVRNFAIDGPSLAKRRARVELTGIYAKNGQINVLYANSTDWAIAYNGQIPPGGLVPLLTDDASHAVREQMFTCSSVYPGSGCPLTVRGTVILCYERNVFGSENDGVPCLNVEDGGTPVPTAAEISAAQAAAAQRQQAEQNAEIMRSNELEAEVYNWEQNVEICLDTSTRVHERDTAVPATLNNFLTRLVRPMQEQNNFIRKLYKTCAQPWPVGAMVPNILPQKIQDAINRCMETYSNDPSLTDWYLCTNNNPPREATDFIGTTTTQYQTSQTHISGNSDNSGNSFPADVEQKIEDCIHSPEMANEGNTYLKCRERVTGY